MQVLYNAIKQLGMESGIPRVINKDSDVLAYTFKSDFDIEHFFYNATVKMLYFSLLKRILIHSSVQILKKEEWEKSDGLIRPEGQLISKNEFPILYDSMQSLVERHIGIDTTLPAEEKQKQAFIHSFINHLYKDFDYALSDITTLHRQCCKLEHIDFIYLQFRDLSIHLLSLMKLSRRDFLFKLLYDFYGDVREKIEPEETRYEAFDIELSVQQQLALFIT